MTKFVIFSILAVLTFVVACGGGSGESVDLKGRPPRGDVVKEDVIAGGAPTAASAPATAQAVPLVPAVRNSAQFDSFAPEAGARPSEDLPSLGSNLEITQRKVISVASVSIEVEVVESAVKEVQVIAESLGGFVEQLSSSGEPERQRANMTIRVPQGQFFTALERIQAIGKVQERRVGSEDVSEQFIDLEARLKSALREEQSLLSLLEKTETVSEILTIERELARVRSEIERFQGRLNFLERRVELATISVNLSPPKEEVSEPPFAALTVEVRDVGDSVAVVKKLLLSLKGSLDSVFLSVNDSNERAEISLRVFAPDFQRTLSTLESQGRVRSKELQEGTSSTNGETPEEPDAHVNVSFIKEAGSSNKWLIVSIAAPIGGVALASLLGFLFYLTYRVGRRRERPV